MKIAIVILARKNSKRIPNKNFKLFNGKPLIHWTLECAKHLGYPVWFFSDCEKMRAYAKKININVRKKPKKYAQDIHDTCKELKQYNKEIQADIFVNLQVTSPIRDYHLIEKWIKNFIKQDKFKCGLSVYKLPKKFFYIDGEPLNFDIKERDNNYKPEEPIFVENGGFYIFHKEMLEYSRFIQKPFQMYLDITGIELDYEWQWENAELVHRRILNDTM